MDRVILIALSFVLSFPLVASELEEAARFYPKSDKISVAKDIRKSCRHKIDHIVNDNFSLFVKDVSNRGGDVVVLVQFRSENDHFDLDFSRSDIRLVDARGRKYRLRGCSLPNFRIESGEAKIFPLVFKNRARSVRQPFKLLIDIYGVGRIVLPGLRIGSSSVEI
jgi:hypothetical protein